MRICILVSGRGSNAEALIRGADTYAVDAVISSRPDAPGLAAAASLGVKCAAEPSVDRIGGMLDEMGPDLVCMAGFMKILPGDVVERHTVMNIHPSLLPKYPGLHAVRRALEGGARFSGCTVHFADSGVDTGRIIAQSAVPVELDDTEETLAARILEREHVIYPLAVRWYAAGMPRADNRARFGPEGDAMMDAIPNDLARSERVGMSASYCGSGGLPCAAVTPDDDRSVITERLRRLA